MTHQPNWKELVQACMSSERAAQMEVYRRVWRDVFPAVLRIVKDKRQAEDIMQESIIKGFDKLNTLLNPEAYPSWQRRLAVNQALMWWRKNAKTTLALDHNEPYDHSHDESNEHLFEDIERELQRLPEGYRMVIQLHTLEQMKHEEIAEALQVEPSTIRSQYSRGMALLRKQLELKGEEQ